MRVAIIGSGYVGLVAGAGFADVGNDVVCVDIDADRVERMTRGEIPIYEPGLDELVRRNADEERLSFTTDTAAAVADAAAVFLAVGTPQSADKDAADLSAVLEAARDVGKALTGWAVIATKSTVPVGTADKVRAAVAENAKHPFAVASNPEFLKEGDAVNDFMKPSRVILGVDDDRGLDVMRKLYAPFVRTSDRIRAMDIRSAELTKYAANTLLATRISFMNELAVLAEKVGADIEMVRRGVGSDPRIGDKFLFAGAGYGGSCFPKDVRALRHTGREAGVDLAIVDAVDRANERQKQVLGERVLEKMGPDLAGKRIAVWGIAFKPKTDDIREAPALTLIGQLLDAGADVIAYDPEAMDNARDHFGHRIALAPTIYEAVTGADALVIVTEWHPFRRPNFKKIRAAMRGNLVFDGRNIWDPAEMRSLELDYYGIGRSA